MRLLGRIVFGSLSLVGIVSCGNLPDIHRAQQALDAGQHESAIRDLSILSDKGFPAAKLMLADYYALSSREEDWTRAEALYQSLLKVEPRALVRLGRHYRSLYGTTRYEMHFVRSAEAFLKGYGNGDLSCLDQLIDLYLSYPGNINNKALMENWLRAQAATRPELALNNRVRYLSLALDGVPAGAEILQLCAKLPALNDECLYARAINSLREANSQQLEQLQLELAEAYHTGAISDESLYGIVKRLEGSVYGSDPALEFFYNINASGYVPSFLALMNNHVGTPSRELPEADLNKLMDLANRGDSYAAYLVGRLFFSGRGLPQDPAQAEHYLKIAAREQKAAAYRLGLLYRDGWLGKPDFISAMEYFLVAARAGSKSADRALAQMFWLRKGIKQNPVYAYSFAKLANESGDAKARTLYLSIVPHLSSAELNDAEALYGAEKSLRSKLHIVRPNQIVGLSDE